MTIIDAHAHLWQRARTPQDWIDPAAMPALDQDFWLPELHEMQHAAGIDGAILVQSVNSAQETRDLLAASEDQSVFGVVGWVDLDGDVPAQLDALAGEVGGDRLVGIRHLAHEDPDPQWLARPSLDFATLADRGLTFDLVVHPHQLAMAAQVVEANPNTRFVLDHLGNPPIASGELEGWR